METFVVSRRFLENVKSHLDKMPIDYAPDSAWQLSGEINSILVLSAQHRVHADEKPATVKAALSTQNILSRLFGWFSAFRR